MPSTYTQNLALQKPATGEQAGLWGVTANNNYDYLDRGIDGNTPIQLSSPAYTLQTIANSDTPGRNKVLVFTGTLAADCTVTISPATAQKVYFVINHTLGGFAINFTQGSGGNFKLANGYSAVIYCDGAGDTAIVKGALTDLQVNSLLVLTNLTIQAGGQISWSGPATFNQPATFQQTVAIQGLATMSAGATISAPLTFALGGDAPYDTYYRSSAGPVARLANGTPGQVLTATAAGPSWASPPATGIGAPISGASGNFILYVNTAGNLAQDSQLIWRPTFGLGIGKNPTYPIDVQGDLNISGLYRVGGNPLAVGISSLPFQTVQATANQGLGGSYVDIPGTLIFPTATGRYLILATVHFQGGADASLNINVQLLVNNAPQPVSIWYAPGSSSGSEGTASAHWIVGTLTPSIGVKLQGARVGGSGSATVTSATTISMIWIAPT